MNHDAKASYYVSDIVYIYIFCHHCPVCTYLIYVPLHTHLYFAESSINTASETPNGDVEIGTKPAKLSSAWCVCRWLISCMKKDDPAVAATTFQSNAPPAPEVHEETDRQTEGKMCICTQEVFHSTACV